MGIDVGSRKTGVALSDESGTMAFPHAIVPVDGKLIETLITLITEKQVGTIVIGESHSLAGEENSIALSAHALGDALASACSIPVVYESEVFTTQEARRMPDGSMQEDPGQLDASAAALILARFLEKRDAPQPPAYIDIDIFSKITIKVGTVLSAEPVEHADKLLRLMVDVGEPSLRQIVSGIRKYAEDPQALVGKQLSFVTNLEPRTIKGVTSNGMLFAVGEDETFAFMVPDRPVPPGTGGH